MILILQFAVLAAVIIMAGKKLSVYGDAIGDIKGLEKSWIGIVMLASITSLPEVITSTASALSGHPEMAISNVFGSNMFNVFIVFFLDLFAVGAISFSSGVKSKNILTATFSILLTLFFMTGFFLKGFVLFDHINIISIGILILYFIAMKLIYVYEHQDSKSRINDKEVEVEVEVDMTMKQAVRGFVLSSLVVVITGIILVSVAEKISVTPIFGIELGASFVGVILLAVATSLPELTVSFKAVKLGSYDMAAGNILGSNVFNLGIIFLADLFYKGNAFAALTNFHIISGLFSMMLLMVFVTGIIFKEKRVKYDSYIIGGMYIAGMYFLYTLR